MPIISDLTDAIVSPLDYTALLEAIVSLLTDVRILFLCIGGCIGFCLALLIVLIFAVTWGCRA